MPSAKPKLTGHILKQLRELMTNLSVVPEPVQAYIIPTNDAHSSEYVADCDQYRSYVSGFDGSAGTAVITQEHACLWTDARYFLQASQQLDENWTLMREGEPSTPTIGAWLMKTLPLNSNIGVDPKLYTIDMWKDMNKILEYSGHKLLPVPKNLVSVIWSDRPSRPINKIEPLPIEYTGKRIEEKIDEVVREMNERKCTVLVISTLDDIAWTLNLRGSDIAYNPCFFAYLAIQTNHISLFVNLKQIDSDVKRHLTDEMGKYTFSINPYEEIQQFVQNCQNQKVWFPDSVNYFLTSSIPRSNQHHEISPTTLMKAVKNQTEAEGLRNAHIRDGIALCCYFAWLEENLAKGEVITEISGAEQLEKFRSVQKDFIGLSFPTISSSGSNAAIIHYSPTKESDRPITTNSIYLCDSGGQYKDGTTDVTRTVHFGTPTDYEKECFTRVLKGQLKLGSMIFPSKIKGNYLDGMAREFLWEIGLDYGHGTGHGIGHYLNVHEGPMGISWRPMPEDPGLEANMFMSNEPGFYLDGQFGIRIEDIVQIIPANTPHNFNNRNFLTFETVTLCPKQTKMIKVDLLTDKEIELLNNYHQRCRDILGPLLDEQNQCKTKEWLIRETEPIKRER